MNLIICHTPLQAMIALRIISLFKLEKFDCIYISESCNKKNEYYFKKLKSACRKAEMFIVPGNRFSYLLFLISLNVNNDYNKVFFANINSTIIHKILSTIKFKELFSFDDGLANLIKTSFLYSSQRRSITLLKRIIGIKYNIQNIRNMLKAHYSIFNSDNVCKKVIPINLGMENKIKIESNNSISIFIGQPINEQLDISEEQCISIIQHIIRKFNIDYYIPHPRERYKIKDVSYIDTELAIEDYLLNISQNIIIYSFYSTAIFTLSQVDNISIISVYPEGIGVESKTVVFNSYKLIESLGIDIVRVKDLYENK